MRYNKNMTCYNMKSNTQAYSEWLNSKLSFENAKSKDQKFAFKLFEVDNSQ